MTIAGCAAQMLGDSLAMVFAQLKNLARRLSRLHAHFRDSAQEENEPAFPIAALAHGLQVIVVGPSVAFEVVREIQDWFVERAAFAQEKRDQQPTHTAVAIEEGVNSLELRVSESNLDEQRYVLVVSVNW
jgi:hypothetical protein